MTTDETLLVTLTVQQLREILSELRPASDDDAPRDAKAIAERIPGTSRGWLRAHLTPAAVGARQRPLYRPSAVRAALAATKPRPHLSLVRDDPFQRTG